MGHKKPFQFIAQPLNASDSLNLSPMQPWMPPWGSQPPMSPPPRCCCSGTRHYQRWRATSSSSPATQVRRNPATLCHKLCWGSISAHLHFSPIPKPRARWVPSTEGGGKEPLLREGSSWQVAGLYPIPRHQLLPRRSHGSTPHQASEHGSPHRRGLGSPRFTNWPTSSNPGATKYPSHRNSVCSKLHETHY